MLKNLGTIEVVVIAFVAIGLFGTKKLNELARGLGESSKELNKVKKEYEKALNEEPVKETKKKSETPEKGEA